ncbi:hypothetical protein [Methylobacterium sp. J-070]|uniref:hypothetical protein n=1 Tax=Methylobacterium sp. J-070 TaxID=2836650 RepID=UPI001FBA63FA|nr:hypothetical protein [Methylobacterium sp. J-070]MCJ2053692.1 hypothetical protein [Methylobacterium sp. J-070]
MTPAEYVEVVVMPTVREFMKNPADRRLAYLSAIAAFHIPDYLLRAGPPATKPEAELKRIRDVLRSDLIYWYDAIEGMANGAKHCGRDRGVPFRPGDEEYVPPFGFGEGFGGFDHGRWDGPGLRAPAGDDHVFVDNALGYFLLACARHFPDHIPDIEPSDWDPKFKPAG